MQSLSVVLQNKFPPLAKYVSWLPVIIAITLLARFAVLAVLVAHGGEDTLVLGDTTRYLGLAQNVLAGEGYTFKNNGLPNSYRPPGYPAYLMIFEFLGAPLWLASVIQILVSAAVPVFVLWFAGMLGVQTWIGKLASLWAALEPMQIFYSVVLLADVFFSVGMLLALALLLKWMHVPRWKYVIMTGLAVGLCNYFRPVGLYFGLLMLVGMSAYYMYQRRWSWQRIGQLFVVIFLIMITALPWQIRNYTTFGAGPFVSARDYNFYRYGAAFPYAIAHDVTWDDAAKKFDEQVLPGLPVPEDKYHPLNGEVLRSVTLDVIAQYPGAYIQAWLLGTNTFLFSGNYHHIVKRYGVIEPPNPPVSFSLAIAQDGASGLFSALGRTIASPYGILALGGKIYWVLVGIGAFAGMIVYRRRSLTYLIALLTVYLVASLLVVVMGVEARHRYVLNPLFFLYFCIFVNFVYSDIVSRRSRI